MADHRPDVYWEGDTIVIRASSMGGCLGSLVRHGIGFTASDVPEFMQRAFDEGSAAEDEIVRRGCEQAGVTLLDGLRLAQYGTVGEDGQVEAEIAGPGFVVRCHPDGVGQRWKRETNGPGPELKERCAVEAKFLGPDLLATYRRRGLEAMPNYAWQASVEMAATGHPLLYITGEKIRTDDGETKVGEVEVSWIMTPPFSRGQVLARAAKIAGAVRKGDVVECDVRQFPCGFYSMDGTLCSGAGNADDDDVDDAVRVQIQRWKKLAVEGKEQQEHARAELLRLFEENKLSKVEGVSYVPESPKKGSVNYKKMVEAGIDVEQYRNKDSVTKAHVRID